MREEMTNQATPPKISLEAARVNAGLIQEEAARRLGITRLTLHKYETGKTQPRAGMMEKMEKLYGYPREWIRFTAEE